MTGTLGAIARLIRDNDVTFGEGAARLGITREQLDNRLHLMERQGYLNRHGGIRETGAGCCNHSCALCSLCRADVPVPRTISLTPKGMRLIDEDTR